MDKRTCAMIRDLLPRYAASQLNASERALVEEHLRGCADCRAEYREWWALDGLLAEAEAAIPFDTNAVQGLAAIHARLRQLTIPASERSAKHPMHNSHGPRDREAHDPRALPAMREGRVPTAPAYPARPGAQTPYLPRPRSRLRPLLAVSAVAALIVLAAGLFYFFSLQPNKVVVHPKPTATTQPTPTTTPMPTSGSWHTATNWPPYASDMVFAQSAPQTGYLCANLMQAPQNSSQWLYKTSDGGVTWQQVGGISTPAVSVPVTLNCNVFVDNSDANDVFAQLLLMPTTGPTGEEPPVSETLWRSRDGGNTWQQLHMPQLFRGWAMLVVVGARIVAIGTSQQQVPSFCTPPPSPESPHQIDSLYASDDGGMNWKQIGQSLISLSQGSSIGQDPSALSIAGNTLVVQTSCVATSQLPYLYHQAYWSSTDGGTSWKNISLPAGDIGNLTFSAPSNGSFYGVAIAGAVSATSEQAIPQLLYSSDSGTTWKVLPSLDSLPGVPQGNRLYTIVHNVIALPDGSVLADIAIDFRPNTIVSEIFVIHPQDATPAWQRYAPSKGGGSVYDGGWKIASTSQGLVLWGWYYTSSQPSQPVYLAPLP